MHTKLMYHYPYF